MTDIVILQFLKYFFSADFKTVKGIRKEAHYFDGSCFDINETSLGTRWGQALAKPMEQTMEGLRRAGEIVSRWSWIHLKGNRTGGTDMSSVFELVYEKHRVHSEFHGPTEISHLLKSSQRKEREWWLSLNGTQCKLDSYRLVVTCD